MSANSSLPLRAATLLERVRGPVLLRGAWLASAAVAGVAVVRHGTSAIAVIAVLVGLAAAVRLEAFGFLLAADLIVELNGVPGFNANPSGIAISRLQDLMGIATLVGAAVVVASGRVAPRSQLQKSLYVACSALALWWFITWFRTGVFDNVPASVAGRFARDFLYFALTLPLLCDVFVTYPRLLRQVFWTLGVAAAVYAAAQIVVSRAPVNLNFLLHPQLFTYVGSTRRVYSPMLMLIRASFALSLGAMIVGSTPTIRRRAVAPTLLFGTSVLLQLTRAAYIGLAAGFVVAGAIWWFRRDPAIRARARTQLIAVPLCLVILIGLTTGLSAKERHTLSAIGSRAVAGFSEVSSTSGTVATRVTVTHEMLAVLGANWVQGLGFLHPAAHPFPTLPKGSIRNGDLGVLNIVMLMGLVGAVLVYLPMLLILRALVRLPRGPTSASDEWIRLGATIWIIGVIASSLTLQELVSFGGLQLTTVVLAVATSVCIGRAARAST